MTDKNAFVPLIEACLLHNIPFVCFRQPYQKHVTVMLQSNSDPVSISNADIGKQAGFVIAPFSSSAECRTWLLQPDITITKQDMISQAIKIAQWSEREPFEYPHTDYCANKQAYLGQLNDVITAIQQGEASKVVLSRTIHNNNYNIQHTVKLFFEAEKNYPSAFVYVLNMPQVGCWMGATPEKLIEVNNGLAQTVSLAATRPFAENIDWTTKELEEQAIVTRYVETALQRLGINGYRIEGPTTVQAAKLAHLKTLFYFDTQNIDLASIIALLHPNPAICGYPQQQAFDIIERTEQRNRLYYTGFLGVVEGHKDADLYINLRCLQATEQGWNVYVGGGITAQSQPDAEWNETEIKSQTLLRLLAVSH